uniref:CCHC-type domain-containing protein n=1 Tax=Tanacetum cinerariifolium TaxID=118510 RepID=A0A699HTL2_TANCI|nr:hypothetical protein [Tanacetum cinerariifolium]
MEILLEPTSNKLMVGRSLRIRRKLKDGGEGYQYGLESLEERIHVHQKNEIVFEESIAFLQYDVQVRDISIKDLKNQLEETMKEKYDLKEKLTKFEESSKNLTKLINSQMSENDKTGQLSENEMPKSKIFETASDSIVSEIDEDNNQAKDRYKVGIRYHAVSPPYTGNYMPPRADLSFAGLDYYVFKFKISETRTSVNENESIASNSSEEIREEPKTVRIGNVAGARETVGSTVVQKSRIQCYNSKEFGHVAKECQKPKRVKDAAYHREKILLCKQEEAGIQLNAEQADWRDDTDDESEDQELEAHYMYMAQIEEVSLDAADSGPIFDSEPVQKVSTDDHYNVFAIEIEHPEQSKSVHDTYPIQQNEHNVIIDSLNMSYDRE